MEEILPEFENRQELAIADEVASDMRTAMLWARFLAILGFIGTGMMLVISLVGLFGRFPAQNYMMDEIPYNMMAMPGRIMGIVFLCVTVIMFFIYYFLFVASVKIKRAIDQGERVSLLQGTRNLKYYFQIVGVINIVTLAFFVLIAIFVAIGMTAFM